MAYIQPNSTIKILKNCPLDKACEHSLYFSNSTAQETYFTSLTKYSFTNQTYQRYSKNSVRINRTCDDLYDCNYIMFKNINYGSKWFYAFITGTEYINDNCTEIRYQIDVLQSFYFDYEFENSLVEREHTSDDTLGKYTIEENIECGDKIVETKYDYLYPYMLGGVILTSPLKLRNLDSVQHNPYEGYLIPTDDPFFNRNVSKVKLSYPKQDETSYSGISNGLYMYYGFPISEKDVEEYWNVNSEYSRFDMQDPCQYEGVVTKDYTRTNDAFTFNQLIQNICDGKYQTEDGSTSENNIVATFQYPAEITRIANQTAGYLKGYENGVATGDITNASMDLPTSFGNYSPKNNKLFTSPYISMVVSNNNGEIAEYKYELFADSRGTTQGGVRSGGINFRWIGSPIPQFPLTIIPKNYRNIGEDFESSLKLYSNIEALYSGNEYISWKQRNSNMISFSLLTNAIRLISNFNGMVLNGTRGIGSDFSQNAKIAGGSFETISTTLATMRDKQATPPTAYGKLNNECFLTGVKRYGFTFYAMRIKEEFAKIVDDYFTKYGYKVNIMKKPSIRNRSNWTFVKTVGCKISGTNGLNAEWEEEIEKIFDKGVTFWTSPTTMMNYSLANTPLGNTTEI